MLVRQLVANVGLDQAILLGWIWLMMVLRTFDIYEKGAETSNEVDDDAWIMPP